MHACRHVGAPTVTRAPTLAAVMGFVETLLLIDDTAIDNSFSSQINLFHFHIYSVLHIFFA